jgi:DNA-binding LytR/AlgR family response regulator
MRILIVEDDPIIGKDLAYTVADLGYQVTALCRTSLQTLSALAAEQPDLIICDIHLADDEWDGIRLVQEIHKMYHLPVIFLTAFSDAATIQRAALMNPAAYLTKPFDERTLFAAIELATAKFAAHADTPPPANDEAAAPRLLSGFLFVKDKKRLVKIAIPDIRWIKAEGAYSQLCTTQDTHLLSINLGILEDKLRPYPFVRVHRSYVVSFQHIDSIEDDVLHIAHERIPLGKSYRDDFYRRLETL